MILSPNSTTALGTDEPLFSMSDMAWALGVSQSTCKRWCDKGLVETIRTAGGHRRVTRGAVIRFATANQLQIVHPKVIALAAPPATTTANNPVAELLNCLLTGNRAGTREFILGRYVRGSAVADLCDDLIAPAMHQVGHAWETGQADVYQERRSCDLVEEALQEIGRLIPERASTAPCAIGGTLEHDGSRLATCMSQLVLRSIGWRAYSIGAKLPAKSLAASILEYQPRLVWVSVSHPGDLAMMCESLRAIVAALPRGSRLLVGGAATDPRWKYAVPQIELGASMRELIALAKRCAPGEAPAVAEPLTANPAAGN